MHIKISNGQGIIKIISDGFADCLFIEKAVTVNWPDCEGSIGEYYCISNYSKEEQRNFTSKIDGALINGTDNEIEQAIVQFLELFTNGDYQVSVGKISLQKSVFYNDKPAKYFSISNANHEFKTNEHYPSSGNDEYFYSRNHHTLNKKRVVFYKKLIENGGAPKIVIYDQYITKGNEYLCSKNYIIDGHHKLEAYLELKKDIPCVFISKNEMLIQNTNELADIIKPTLKPYEFDHFYKNNPNLKKQ